MKGKNLISIKNLSTNYGDLSVHDELNLDVTEGEVLALIGRNGCGKTTLVEMIMGIRQIQSGEIIFPEDFVISEDAGLQFQDDQTSNTSSMKVSNVISYYKMLYKGKIVQEELDKQIKIFEIDKFLKTKIRNLSTGQKQRLNLLLSIIHKPKLLILDEFSVSLDILSVMDIYHYLSEEFIKKMKATIIIVSHNPHEIKLLANKIAFLNNGKIELIKTKDEVQKEYKENFEEFLIETLKK